MLSDGLQNHVQSLLFGSLKSKREPNVVQRIRQCDNWGTCYDHCLPPHPAPQPQSGDQTITVNPQGKSANLANKKLQLLFSSCHIQFFVTPWTVAHQDPLSSTISWNLLKFMSSWCCYSTISSSVTPFSFCLQSLPASGYFPTSWLFTSGGQGQKDQRQGWGEQDWMHEPFLFHILFFSRGH